MEAQYAIAEAEVKIFNAEKKLKQDKILSTNKYEEEKSEIESLRHNLSNLNLDSQTLSGTISV